MGEFQGEQGKITAVEQKAGKTEKETGKKTHEELETELKAKHDVFFAQVDATQKIFQEAQKLKFGDAKAEMDKSKKEIKDLLTKVATNGETLLKDKSTDFSTIRQSADRISKLTEAVPKNLKFLQTLQQVDNEYNLGTESLTEAKKYEGKTDAQSKKFQKQAIDNAVANLGKYGASGDLWNIEDAGIPPELKWAYDFHKDRTEKAMDEAIAMKVKYANENEFDTDEKKSKMPYALRDLLKSFTEGTDGQGNKKEGYNAMRGHKADAERELSLAKMTDDPVERQKHFDAAKESYKKAKEAGNGAAFTMALLDSWKEGNELPEDWDAVLQQVRRNIQSTVAEADKEIANIERTLEGKVEKEGPETIEKANKTLEGAQTGITDALRIKNEILTDTKMSEATRNDKISSMWGMARAHFDTLTGIHRELGQVDKSKLSAEYQKLLGEILTKSAKQIQELADIKLYCETKHFVEGDGQMKKYFVFKPDGTVEQTSEFLGLDVWKQEELLKQLHALPQKIQLEMEEKMATPEAKNMIEGKKKLASGDWIGAKQDLLKYYNANINAEGHDEAKIAESKELLKQIAKLEIAQAASRILAMRESIQGRFEWRVLPGEKTDYGVQTKDQAYMYLEDMSLILAKAEQMIDKGECLTIGDAELKLREMQGTLSTSTKHYQDQLAELKDKDPNDPELAKQKASSIQFWKVQEESAQKAYDRAMRGEPDPLTGDLPTPESIARAKKQLDEAKGTKGNLEGMTAEQYLQSQIIQTQSDLNNEKLKSALVRFNSGFNGTAGVFDVFKQQRLLNEPDKEKRDANILDMAKTARERGLTELAKQYYGMYFEKELGEKAKTISHSDVLRDFVKDEDNTKHIDKQVDNWKEAFKKKVGREPTEGEVDKIRGEMMRVAVDGAYSKAVKKALHADMQGRSGGRADAWNDAYGGKVVLEDLGTGWFSDEEWNALPAKVAVTTSIIIVSAATAGAAVELAGAGYCAMALLGEGALGRVAAFGANLAVESLVFVSTEGLLNGAIQGDWSTFESGGAFLKAWGHNALTLGTLKGVGGGFGKLRGAVSGGAAVGEAAYMPQSILKSAASDAGWWAARTTAESSALTAQAWALNKMQGKQFGSHEAFKSFGENVVFSASIGISHGIMGSGGHGEAPKAKELKETKDATKAVVRASEADIAAGKAREKVDQAKAKGKETGKLEQKAKELETKAKELDTKAVEAMRVEARAKAEAEVAAKKAELQGHLDGMCPCHRAGMKSIIDAMGIDKVTDPVEKSKLMDQAIKQVKEYQAAQDKNEGGDHIAKAREALREKLLDPNTAEGKDLAGKLEGKKVQVKILNPDGSLKTEMEMSIDKRLLTPDTLLKIASGEPVTLTEVDVYLHKHMLKGVSPVLEKVITDPATLEAKRKEILDAMAKGEDITKIVESISDDPAVREKLKKDLLGAEEKVRQGSEVFTTPHAEMNAEGRNIAKEYMHETVNNVFDDFAAKFEKETGRKLDPKAIEKIKQRIIEAGIDQHIDNPPQYVSHGFDHSLRVMENVRRLLAQTPEQAAKGPPEAVQGLMDKYKITRSQAELMTQLVGICHDFGYPTVGDMNKSLHAVTGTYRFLVDIGVPLGEAMGLDLKGNVQHMKLLKNFAESIECHSADKVETSYEDDKGKRQELKFDSKIKFRIKIPGTEIFYYQEFLLRSKDKAEFREKGIKFFKENMNIDLSPGDVTYQDAEPGKVFEGRYIDAPGSTKKGSLPGGIEFKGAELNDASRQGREWESKAKKGDYEFNPLLSLVRYADNLDMDSSRFSPFQRSKVFTNLYERLGAERSVDGDKTLSTALVEQLRKVPPSLADAQSVLTKTAKPGEKPVMYEGELLTLAKELVSKGPDSMNALRRLLDSVQLVKYGTPPTPLDAAYIQQVKARIEAIATNQALPEGSPGKKDAKALKSDMQGVLADNIFRDEEAHVGPQDKQFLPLVKKYLGTVNEVSFRHFGGCNPVEVNGVKVESGTISVGMLPDVVRRYRGLSAEERVPLPGGGPMDTMSVNIPVAVYQVWRAVEAYESVTVNGKKLKISLRVGDKTFNFDPNKYGEGSGESASAAFLREYKAWEAANIK